MASISYRCNLSAKSFPLLARNQSRTVIVPGNDQPYTRYGSVSERLRDVNTPQAYYMENVLPTIEGYLAVGYKTVQATEILPGPNIVKVKELYRNGSQYFVGEANTGSFYNLGSGISWTSPPGLMTGNVCTNYNENAVSYATVNGVTYVLQRDIFSSGTNFSVFSGTDMTNTATSGLTLFNIIGIVGANGYNIAYSKTAVAWSSLVDPTDFVPSLITGAGGGSIQEAKGYIQFCLPASFGFIVYCERNCVAAVYTGNSRNPFKFTEIKGSGGGVSPELVARDVGQQFNIAWTTKGLQRLGPAVAENIHPELEALIYTKYKESLNLASNSFTTSAVSIRLGRLVYLCNRYLCYSFNAESASTSESGYTDVIVYDSVLERWGRLSFDHAHLGEFHNYVAQGTPTNYTFTDIAHPIFLISKRGLVYQLGERFGSFSGGESAIILGKFQYVRAKRLCLDKVNLENSGQNFDSTSITCVDLPTQEDATNETPVSGTVFSSRSTFKVFHFNVDAIAHSLLIKGGFNLTNVELEFHPTGNT